MPDLTAMIGASMASQGGPSQAGPSQTGPSQAGPAAGPAAGPTAGSYGSGGMADLTASIGAQLMGGGSGGSAA